MWALRGAEAGSFKLVELMCPDDGNGVPGVDAYAVGNRAKELALVPGETVHGRWRISGVSALEAIEGPGDDSWAAVDPKLNLRLCRVRGTLTLTDRRVAVVVPKLRLARLKDLSPGELLARLWLFRVMRCVCAGHIPLESIEAVAVDGRELALTVPLQTADRLARFRLRGTIRASDGGAFLEALVGAQRRCWASYELPEDQADAPVRGSGATQRYRSPVVRPLGSDRPERAASVRERPVAHDVRDGVLLSEAANAALELAASRRHGRPLETFGILQALIAMDTTGAWDTVQLRSTFVAAEASLPFRDRDGMAAGHWRRVPLTAAARAALAFAASTADDYRLFPTPPGLIALGLVADPDAGACRALLDEADIGHEELLSLLQDELLDTRLEGLRPASVAAGSREASPAPADPPPPEEPITTRTHGPFAARPDGPQRRPEVPPSSARLPALPEELRRRLEGGHHLRRRTATTDPWVIAVGDRVYKIYDLESLEPSEQQRVRSRAAVGLAFNDLDGVVPSFAVTDEGSVLIVEMPQMGPSLQQHLDATAVGAEPRLSPELYAEALARMARTLERLHERGLVHGHIKPANLLVDPMTGWLAIADVSNAGSADRAAARRTLRRPAIDRFIAPEQQEGELGASVDQYALGRTAQDVFNAKGSPPLTTPVHDVLRRAMAPRAGDRFETVAAFAAGLEEAVRMEAPRGLAERLAQLRPSRRAALEPGVLALVVSMVCATVETRRDVTTPELALLEVLPAVAVITWLTWAAVAFAGTLGRKRPFPSVGALNHPFLAPIVAASIGGWLLLSTEDPNWVVAVWCSLIGVYGVRALLAAPPSRAGSGVARVLRLWDRRRLVGSALRWALSMLALAIAIGILGAPAIVTALAPRDWPTYPVSDFAPLAAVWNFRSGLGREDSAYVCTKVTELPQAQGRPPCERLIRAAAAIQSTDPILRGSVPVAGEEGTWQSFLAQEIPAPEGRRFWRLLAPGKAAVQVGSMYTVPPTSDRIDVMIDRRASVAGGSGELSVWMYNLERRGDAWKVIGFRACDLGSPGTGIAPAKCVITESTATEVVAQINAAAEKRP